MKTDLDRLMAARKLDAAVIFGPDGLGPVNSAFNWFVGGRHVVGTVIKLVGKPALVVHGVMERDNAAATGLELVNVTRWSPKEIAKEFPDPFDQKVELHRRMFTDLGAVGRVGVYGTIESGFGLALMRALEAKIPGLTVVAEGHRSLIEEARETKDAAELAAMEEVGRATCAVVGRLRDWLLSHALRGGVLRRTDGAALTVGDVKAHLRRLTLEAGLESTDPIFSVGRDAGVPHSHGTPGDPIAVGVPLLLDYYPRRPGGYYHDMTRTWCLGPAPAAVKKAYDEVRACFDALLPKITDGTRTYTLQQAACDFFEAAGHSSVRKDPARADGYIHSLGHGLGLDVHEQPFSPTFADIPTSTIRRGVVYTLEPGLYYPEQGIGMRIEDTIVCDLATGLPRSITPFPYDLELPVKQ